jgi:hypothetical protein
MSHLKNAVPNKNSSAHLLYTDYDSGFKLTASALFSILIKILHTKALRYIRGQIVILPI